MCASKTGTGKPGKTDEATTLVAVSPAIKTERVKPSQLFLDPQNPRLLSESAAMTADKATSEPVQAKLRGELVADVDDVLESIKANGYIPVDRITVRPLEDGAYIVVEGNRRVTAIHTLLEQHKTGQVALADEVAQSLSEIEVVVVSQELELKLMGLRHLTGPKPWPRLQQAKFIAKNYHEKQGLKAREIGKIVHLSGQEVNLMIRSYFAYEQAKADDDFGDKIEPEKFSMFQEGVFKSPSIRDKWLDWDDNTKSFRNLTNFRMFLQWITTPAEDDKGKPDAKPRISRSMDVQKILSELVLDENKTIFEKFQNETLTIKGAESEMYQKRANTTAATDATDIHRVLESIEDLSKKLTIIPLPKVKEDAEARKRLQALFTEIKSNIETYATVLETFEKSNPPT